MLSPKNGYEKRSPLIIEKNGKNFKIHFCAILSSTKNNYGRGNLHGGAGTTGWGKGVDDMTQLPVLKYSNDPDLNNYFLSITHPQQIKAQVINGQEYSENNLRSVWEEQTKNDNELVTERPRVEQIYILENIDANDIPPELKQIADEYGIPIIIGNEPLPV